MYLPKTYPKCEHLLGRVICIYSNMRCLCSYETAPILHLRGYCLYSDIDDEIFTPMTLNTDQAYIGWIGSISAQITFNIESNQWVLQDRNNDISARADADQISFALGKHNWTISGDSSECSSDIMEMKLTGCKDGEFTCDDGQCISMEKRCNQLQDCRDDSDELGCKILELKYGYNKRVPPISQISRDDDLATRVAVHVSMTLIKVVAINEEGNSMELQFQITLEWKENRVTFQNLKKRTFLNALSEEDIKSLWLPLIVYTNTDQQETTRLGMEWEWTTNVLVKREGAFERSGYGEVEEIEFFKGSENILVLEQTYTHKFQCVFQLKKYPFDTQVCTYS